MDLKLENLNKETSQVMHISKKILSHLHHEINHNNTVANTIAQNWKSPLSFLVMGPSSEPEFFMLQAI
jgi:hypothetical protein